MENNENKEIRRSNTYSDFGQWRVTAILLCIVFAFIFSLYNSTIILSSYDSFMVRSIFWNPGISAETQEIPVGAFWKWMGFYIAGTFAAGSIVLIANTSAVNKNRRAGALLDIITYAVLALTIPAYFIVSIIGSRANYLRILSFTFSINLGAFIGFAVMFFSHLKLYKANKDAFEDGKSDTARKGICIAALFLPVVFMCAALILAAGYSHNYGRFKGRGLTDEVNVDNMLYNYYYGAVEYDDCLYFDSSQSWMNNPHRIYRVDRSGNLTHLIDIERDISYNQKLRFDVYGDDIYYVAIEREGEDAVRYNFTRVNYSTGASEVILSDIVDDSSYHVSARSTVDMFKIFDGKLYFHISGDGDDSIYYLDLEGDPSEKILYVSDISYLETAPDSLTYRFVYGYNRLVYSLGYEPFVYHGDYVYYNTWYYDDDSVRTAYFTVRRLKDKEHETVFQSPHVDGMALYDDTIYIFNYDTNDLFALDMDSGEYRVLTTLPDDNGDEFTHINGLWAYGGYLIMSVDNEPFVIAR